MKWFEQIANDRKPDLVVEAEGKIYLTRWWVIPRNRFFNIYLHKITASDEPTLHDHPWANASFILQGEMYEYFIRGGRVCKQGRLYFRGKKTFHYLEMLDSKIVWTLFFTFRNKQKWGFLTAEGWIPAALYKGRPGVRSY